MYAIEFETHIDSEYIRIPDFAKFKNKQVRVILLSEEEASEASPADLLTTDAMQTIVNQARASGISEMTLEQMKYNFIASSKD